MRGWIARERHRQGGIPVSGQTPMDARSNPWAHRRSVLRALAKVALSGALILGLVYWLDWREVGKEIAGADPGLLVVALLVLIPTVPLVAGRWMQCAIASGIRLPPSFFAKATYSATFAGQFLPAGVGVDAVRLAYFVHQRARLAHALQSIVLDRLVGIVTIVLVLALGMPVIWDRLSPVLRLFATALVLATAFGVAVLWGLGRLRMLREFAGTGKRKKLITLLLGVRGSLLSRAVGESFLLALAAYGLNILSVMLITASLGTGVGYWELLAVVSMAMFASLLPISVNGWGIREGAMVVGLSVLAVPKATAFGVSILFGISGALVTLPGAFLWYIGRHGAANVDQV